MGDADAWGQWDFHSDDEEDDTDFRNLSRTALIVIISCSPDMFRIWGTNPDKPIVAALKCCHSMWRTKVISSPKDKVAILLTGTEHEKNTSRFPNLYVLQEMSTIKASMIDDLQKMIKDPTDLNGFQDSIGVSSDYDMFKTFWQANLMFEEGDVKNISKKIMLFTCEDNPHGDNLNLQQDTIQKFKDLRNVDFSIATFYPEFDYTRFYSKIIPDESAIINAKDCDSLLKVVRIKQRIKRPITRIPFELAPEIKLSVGLYSLIRKASKPKSVKVDLKNNELVDRNVKVFDAGTGLPILKAEENKFIEVGGEKAVFTPSELKDLKYNFQTGIFLIGFLDESQLDQYAWFRSPGYFIYPDDEKIKGSKDIFVSLLKRCSALKKIMLVRFVMTRGRTSKLGCLVPSVGKNAKLGPEFPQGFHLIVLPFADEIRHHEVDECPEATAEMVDAMEAIVNKLTQKNFSVTDVQSPALYREWRNIEGAALSLADEDESFQDLTVPNTGLMQERAGDLMTEFNGIIQMAGYHSAAEASSAKSKNVRSGSGSESQAKKPKIDFDMENEWRHNRLEKLTVAVLKEFIKERGIAVQSSAYRNAMYTNLPKAEYISYIKKYFQNK